VKKLRVKELCVRKLACFFPHWVKVGLPSDAAGRSAITRMRIDRPMLLCTPGKAHQPIALAVILGYEPGLRAKSAPSCTTGHQGDRRQYINLIGTGARAMT